MKTTVSIALVVDPTETWRAHDLATRSPVWVVDAPTSRATLDVYAEPEWHDSTLRRAGVSFVSVPAAASSADVLTALLAQAATETDLTRVHLAYVVGASTEDASVRDLLVRHGFPITVVTAREPQTCFIARRGDPSLAAYARDLIEQRVPAGLAAPVSSASTAPDGPRCP